MLHQLSLRSTVHTLLAPLGLASLLLTAAACNSGERTEPAAAPVDTAALGGPEGAAAEPELPPVAPREDAPAGTAPAADPVTAPAPTTASPSSTDTPMTDEPTQSADTPTEEIATLGAGCFWCIEAVLEQVEGVKSVVSGYTGGQTEDPTYKDICTGRTGHAEVVQVTFDPSVLSYAELLDWFWRLHDPTTLNRQGNDRGTQYRSAIFYHSDEQRRIAETSKKDVQPSFDDPIVTEVTAAATFYPAEQYHQGYYFDNSSQGYCRMVIAPKLKKLGLKY